MVKEWTGHSAAIAHRRLGNHDRDRKHPRVFKQMFAEIRLAIIIVDESIRQCRSHRR
jgi:hypothetical protein